jgi:predicted Zn finger-like uncharacterized protein
MPEIIGCPECSRKLRVPDDLLGKRVKCPTCGLTFTAELPGPPPAPPRPYEAEAPPPPPKEPAPPVRRRRPLDDEDDDDYDDLPRRRRRRVRRDAVPHRGTLILVLGILSIVLCGFFGPVAWVMGHNDLNEIRAGRMDPDGEGTTRGGEICGMVGTVLLVLQVLCICVPGLISMMSDNGAFD